MLAALIALSVQQPTFANVYQKADRGYTQIRIPSLVTGLHGMLLAFAEGRNTDKSDQGSNKILLRRSRDNGKTWFPIQVLDDQGASSLNNPCAVVDRPSGRIFLFYQRVPAGLSEGSPKLQPGYGKDTFACFVISSRDEGMTWTAPRDITRSVKRPEGATTICSGPGIGIQLTRDPHVGRLVVPFNEGPFYEWNNYAVFSDDHGATWRWGANVPGAFVANTEGERRSEVNEVQMAELSDGSVMLNSRQFAGAKVRKSAISHDGGETWSPIQDVPALNDPSCMGSLFRYSFGPGRRNVLLYSGPNSASDRVNGTLHASFDDGVTWPVNRVLVPGKFAYSVLTRLPNGDLGCLFETDDYQKITFARVPLPWLLGSH